MAFTAENVEKAVQQFYKDAVNQQEINKWLMSAQTSQQAWQFCWPLLAKDKSPEVQFFGASTLHIKIARFWHEVPAEQVSQLRDSLFEQLIKFAAGPKMVLTRLCVVLSSFTLQMVPNSWTNAVSDIISTFQQSQHNTLETSQACLVLLEVLTVLPEEFGSSQFPQQRKAAVRLELKKGIQQVLTLLQQCCVSTAVPPGVHCQALRCLSSWIQFGLPLTELDSLTNHVFEAIHNESSFEVALETLINIFSHPEGNRYPRTMQKLLIQVLQLQSLLQKAIDDKDMDMCQGLCKLIVCAADSNTQLILDLTLSDPHQSHLALSLVNMVLQCTSLPGYYPVDEYSSSMPFGFWYNFQDDIKMRDTVQCQALLVVYTTVYMQLVEILLRKAQYPPDNEYNTWNAEEKEEHRCYRQDIADTLMYAYNLLHDRLLASLCQLLATSLERLAAEQVRWQEIESVLFAVTSVAESVDPEETAYLPTMFSMLSRLPCDNLKVISQALYLIGAYAEWISSHPEMLGHVIPLMLQGVTNTDLAQPATLSLKEVLRENQDHLKPFAQPILTACKEALDKGNLKARDTVRLMACLGYVLSVLPVDETMEYLNIILSPYIQQLQELAQAQMLSWLFDSLITTKEDSDQVQQSRPVYLVLQQVLPVLWIVLQKWIMDSDVVANTCDMLKRALRAIMDDNVTSLLSDIAHLLLEMYQIVPQAAMLDLAKQLLLLSVSDLHHQSAAQNLFDTLCRATVTLLQRDAQNYPDVFEGFMSLLAQLMKKDKKVYENTTFDLEKLFDVGVLGLCMKEAHTIKASSYFLIEFLGAGTYLPLAAEVVRNKGLHLLDRLLRSVGGEAPRAVMDCMADLLLALNKHHFESLCKWMNHLVAEDGYPNPRVSEETKKLFARLIIMERVNKRKMRETVQEYTLLWRGMIGTEYAAQTVNMLQAST
ncbi:hypothetical protein LSH36_209g00066 [Paralvinella palmiformis]|uniref:Importin-13 n=1 Tax=Paralvinella palmiformis TaxID=53620 RepID=A0AAD9JNN1_9ANNE|nr:hypothetical protein LSH36_209g00066 [Paralvinella palmiformis]